MQAGKNRKRDLKLLSEVYSSNLLGEGMKDYYAAQEQDTGSSGYQQARMAPNMGTETHTGYPAEAEDQNPVENYEGEEETLQEMSGRMLTRKGWKKSEVTGQGNWVFTKADQPDAHVGTDGLINGKDYKLFFKRTGEDPGTEEAEENDQSTPQPEDTGVNADENRGSWGSAAFGNESEESHEDHEAMLIGRRAGGCGDNDDRHGSSDPTHNPRALGGMVDIIAKAISDQNEDAEDIDDDDMLMRHHKKMAAKRDTDLSDERYFKRRDKQEDDAAEKQGFNPDENAEDGAAAAMRADERENKKNLSDQDLVAKIYGYNPDENQEEFPWTKEIDPDDAFDNDLGDGPDTDESDKREFEEIDAKQWAKAKKAGWSGGASENEEYEEDESDDDGNSNAGKYKNVSKDKFCGPSGGSKQGTYPVNTRKRAIAAKSYAHNAPDPAGIDRCVDRKWPDLDKDEKKESYFKSSADKSMTQLMESYQSVVKGNHGQIL
jgi:hypothetical protein